MSGPTKPCVHCRGSGYDDQLYTCGMCRGSGRQEDRQQKVINELRDRLGQLETAVSELTAEIWTQNGQHPLDVNFLKLCTLATRCEGLLQQAEGAAISSPDGQQGGLLEQAADALSESANNYLEEARKEMADQQEDE